MEIKKLEQLVSEKLNEFGYELVSLTINIVKGEKNLVIIVDRVEPIDMDAIVDLSHKLNTYLDEIDPIEEGYTLDISSLGAEKPLKIEKLKDYINSYINVHLVNPINGENIYEGNLDEVNDDSIILSFKEKTRTKVVDIKKSNISKIRLAIKF